MIYKVCVKNGHIQLIDEHADTPDGWFHDGYTSDPYLVENMKVEKIQWIKEELERLDFKSIRPLREGNLAMVQEIETQAEALRVELRALLAA